MAKPKPARRTLDSYTVKHISKTIRPGDCVLMRPSDSSKPSYVARVEKIEADSRGANVRIHVRWYYRPEESIGGRRQFHGSKEVFLSDHFDIQSADTVEGKCTVHSFKSYTKLDAVGNDDFFCRFEYNSSTGAFNPDRVAVTKLRNWYDNAVNFTTFLGYLVNLAHFPVAGTVNVRCLIILMILWFNVKDAVTGEFISPESFFNPLFGMNSFVYLLIGFIQDMTPEEAKRVDHFYCHTCSSEDQKRLENSHVSTRIADAKVDTKRRRR
ncbi:hypothetical protein DH2020_044794 [Rehmannia glutinosa]|uniref:BAH domain-containing protein n=1 Tax=Rehmannia glutinosa TaxID=99300 RepID=A0ABR0UG02_REHGL